MSWTRRERLEGPGRDVVLVVSVALPVAAATTAAAEPSASAADVAKARVRCEEAPGADRAKTRTSISPWLRSLFSLWVCEDGYS